MSNSKVFISFVLLFVLLVSFEALNCELHDDEEISIDNKEVHELINTATYSLSFLPPSPPSKPFPGPNTIEPPPPPQPRPPPPRHSKHMVARGKW